LNASILCNTNSNSTSCYIFTLDVIALYPSIKPSDAQAALQEALLNSSFTEGTRTVIFDFVDLIFKNSFVCFYGEVYTGKDGIPTGNCVSRQMADIMLHRMLFYHVKPNLMALWKLITFWKRFIDDIIGLWTGTIRQFNLFVGKLNDLTRPYGIQFGDSQIGKSVNFLDVTLTLNANNTIEYKLYKKDTDARLYLQTDSFHPPHVFNSVIFSQMIRVIQRNSQDHTCVEDIAELKADLMKSGHDEDVVEEVEPLAAQRAIENELYTDHQTPKTQEQQLVYSVKYFKEVDQLKQLVHSVRADIVELCGDTKITFALRKQPSIGNTVVRNRKLSESVFTPVVKSQKCGSPRCQTCPYLFNHDDEIIVNGIVLRLDFNLSCKDQHVIYVAQCQLCNKLARVLKDDTYFGQTIQEMHCRMNGHRNKFVIDSNLIFEKSALSMHCFLAHKNEFNMSHFKLGIVKKVKPVDLDRDETFYINKFRTNIWGLNRISVVR
jgi:hypothetical protein